MNPLSQLHMDKQQFALYTGYIATVLSIIAFMPLVYDVYKNNNTKGLVFNTLVIFFLSQVMWFLHGASVEDTPILFSTFINMLLYIYLIYRYLIKK